MSKKLKKPKFLLTFYGVKLLEEDRMTELKYKGFSPAEIAVGKIEGIIFRHAEEAAFLWLLRDAAVRRSALHAQRPGQARRARRGPPRRPAGRRRAGWEIVKRRARGGEPGEVFAAAVLAFESGERGRIQCVLEAGVATPEAARGLISALGWLPIEQASGPIKALLAADQPARKRVGIAGGGGPSQDAIGLPCSRRPWPPTIRSSGPRPPGRRANWAWSTSTSPPGPISGPRTRTCRFWAAWSNALLNGHKDAVACLQNIAEGGGPFAERAAQMAMRRLPPNDAKVWLKKLVKELGTETDRHHRRRRVRRSRGRPLPDRPDEGSPNWPRSPGSRSA